eukprot:TRINITY_DN20119_c0_g1_i1.p1 TRINITY_DN20119_c0_g1~~TRINITY_DN20119_c0_g1_i1.p1  ORF type:complete len:177 (-),score=36.28 TRINITY_DN20119_c0_g1_i1:27-557(-)
MCIRDSSDLDRRRANPTRITSLNVSTVQMLYRDPWTSFPPAMNLRGSATWVMWVRKTLSTPTNIRTNTLTPSLKNTSKIRRTNTGEKERTNIEKHVCLIISNNMSSFRLWADRRLVTSTVRRTNDATASVVRGRNTAVSYTHLRAHETPEHLVCRLLLEKKKINILFIYTTMSTHI